VAIVGAVAIAVRKRERYAEFVIGELLREQACRARIVELAVLVVRVFRRDGEAIALEVERAPGDEIDGRTEGTLIGARGGGLAHLERAEEIGGEGVEVELAAAVRSRA